MSKRLADVQKDSIVVFDSLRHSFITLMPLLVRMDLRTEKKFEQFLKLKKIKEIKRGKSSYFTSIKLKDEEEFEELHKHFHTTNSAPFIVSRSFFVSLFSQYDTFLANLLKSIFSTKPEILNSSDKTLTYSKIKMFNNLSQVKDYILDNEVDSLLREKNYTEIMEYIESRLGIDIINKIKDTWINFIEMYARRNICVHNDGIVNEQYLSTCKYWNYLLEKDLKKGDQLVIEPDYFLRSYDTLYEIIIVLSQIVWRKQIPKEVHLAEHHLESIIFDLLKERKYPIVINIILFCLKNFDFTSEVSRLSFIINLSLAYKLKKDKKRAEELLDEVDWSAKSDLFILSAAIVKEDEVKFREYMLKIGKGGDIKKEFYRTWPLFTTIEKKDVFDSTFKKIFNEPYNVIEKNDSHKRGLLEAKH